MKKTILLLLISFLSITSQSQVLISLLLGDKLNSPDLEFGLEGGGNFSKIYGLESNRFERDWDLGFYFDFRVKHSNWFVYTGVLVKAKLGSGKLVKNDIIDLGGTIYPYDGVYSQKINYFLVPILAKYRFKNKMYVEGGTQLGLMYKAWIEFEYQSGDDEVVIKNANKDAVNRIDAGLMAGTGYRFKGRTGWTIGVKYYYGLVNVYKNKPGTKNSSVFIKINIPIGAGEKAQKKREDKAKQKAERKAQKEKEKEKN